MESVRNREFKMKRSILTLIAAVALAFTMVGGVAASEAPGTPGEKNCHGQTIRYLAQAGKEADVQEARGLGQLADYAGVSVQDIQDIAAAYCASTGA